MVLQEIPDDSTAVGVPAHVVKIAGERVSYASAVDQIHITDPVSETMKSLLSRVEFLEAELDKLYQKQLENQPQEEE